MSIARSAGGLVVGPGKKILVVNQNHDSWSLPKGHLDPGETALEAARREIAEEAGVTDLELLMPLGTYTRTRLARGSAKRRGGPVHKSPFGQTRRDLWRGREDKTQRKHLTFFLFRTQQKRLAPHDPHNPEARWVDPLKVEALLTHPKDRQFFKEVWGRAQKMLLRDTFYWKSPLGWLEIHVEGRVLRRVGFASAPRRTSKTPTWISRPLSRYFSNRTENLDSLRNLPDGTAFQRRVWEALAQVPRGRTASYAEIARRAGRPKAIRAAASAVGDNPLCLVIPCHRIIASSGSLGGYAFGIRTKAALLKLEGIQL